MNKPLVFSTVAVLTVGVLGGGSFYLKYKVDNIRENRLEQDRIAHSLKREDISVTIVEGKRREEIARLLEERGVCSAASFLKASEDKEGTLFPDTYRFFPQTEATAVVEALVNNFAKKAGSPNQNQLILASIVEREAVTDEERPIIAGIYTNRLRIGMKLEADPTVQYAKDTLAYEKAGEPTNFTFWSPITQDDYQGVNSPYNVYKNVGLPPSPIANPGLKSIAAAMNPQENEYIYFVHRNGQIYPATTLSEHLRNAAR